MGCRATRRWGLRLALASAAVGLSGCGGGEEPTDPRLASAASRKPDPAVVARAKNPKYDAFRALAREERKRIAALTAFRRGIGDRAMTAEEIARYDALMAAVKPTTDACVAYLERPELGDDDRAAILAIYEFEIPAEFPTEAPGAD